MTMQPTMIQLSSTERQALAEAAEEEGISRSELMRRALREYLAERTAETVSRRVREGYEHLPETEAEVAAAMAGARRMLSDPDLEW